MSCRNLNFMSKDENPLVTKRKLELALDNMCTTLCFIWVPITMQTHS